MSRFVPFPKIVAFKNICKYAKRFHVDKTVTYAAKIKLHGTNAAIRITNGSITAQSRSRDITTLDDNMGFARWVDVSKESWIEAFKDKHDSKVVVFGEWAGKCVQRGDDAVIQLDDKFFFVFGILIDDVYHTNPESISKFLPEVPNLFVIPWCYTPGENSIMTVKFTDEEGVNNFIDFLNDEVEKIGKLDPFIKDTFDVSGPGEGLVLTPFEVDDGSVLNGEVNFDIFEDFVFKAKTEVHMGQKIKSVTKEIVAPSSVIDFVDEFVTDARCSQALSEACKGEKDKRHTKKFIDWMMKDVREESVAELEKMNVTWDDVSKQVLNASRKWFLAR